MGQKEFGLFFSKLREKSGFESQRQLAIASGISNGTIARIESGTQRPNPETLKTLSKYLKGTNYDELMFKAGYLEASEYLRSVATTGKDSGGINDAERLKREFGNINVAYFGGAKEELTEEEAERLKEELEMFRMLKAKRMRERQKDQ